MNKILRIHETNRFPKKIAGFPPQKNPPHPWLLHETVDFRHGIGMAILAVQSYTWVVYGKSMGNNYPRGGFQPIGRRILREAPPLANVCPYWNRCAGGQKIQSYMPVYTLSASLQMAKQSTFPLQSVLWSRIKSCTGSLAENMETSKQNGNMSWN